jgi:hypothetical protein
MDESICGRPRDVRDGPAVLQRFLTKRRLGSCTKSAMAFITFTCAGQAAIGSEKKITFDISSVLAFVTSVTRRNFFSDAPKLQCTGG